MNKRKTKNIRRSLTSLEKDVLGAMERVGLEPYVYVLALSGSCYIRFTEPRLRSLRIGDHNGRVKYKYKWNLRADCGNYVEKVEDGVKRFFYPILEYMDMVNHMRNYLRTIRRNDKSYPIEQKILWHEEDEDYARNLESDDYEPN